MTLLGRTQSAQFFGLCLNSFIEPTIFQLIVDEIRFQLKSCALRDLTSLLVLAIVVSNTDKLRVEPFRVGCVGIVPHNFIRSRNISLALFYSYNLHHRWNQSP